MNTIEQLSKLYMESSKHSNYQVLPSELRKILPQEQLVTISRQEYERLEYICSKIGFEGKNVLDIGGNTGFFTMEAIKAGAKHVDYYEGNKTHAEFVTISAKVLDCEQKITVFPEYYLFDPDKKVYDIVLCLNVVHHLGDDFGAGKDIQSARNKMLRCINSLASITDIMVFQMGFNWCGNTNCCLFENGTKKEMEDFLQKGTKDFWEINKIGIAESNNGVIEYKDMDEHNNMRIDSFGEFLNRPLFIMQSKVNPIFEAEL